VNPQCIIKIIKIRRNYQQLHLKVDKHGHQSNSTMIYDDVIVKISARIFCSTHTRNTYHQLHYQLHYHTYRS